MRRVLILVGAFCGLVYAANWLTESHGFVSVGFGLSATAGTYAAGLTFGIRDALHEAADQRWPNPAWMGTLVVSGAIVVGAGLSAVINPQLALASGVAFLIAEMADLAIYAPMRRRQWVAGVMISNVVGSFVDTVVFLQLAGFPIREAVAGQMVGKSLMILPAIPLVWFVRNRGRR
jgi:queuosine precursor transporter